MNTAWTKEPLTGRVVPKKPHLVPCSCCEGAGSHTDRHPHDPAALDVECDECKGSGLQRCADDGCCDFDPPEDG
jgi:hypothetical protein